MERVRKSVHTSVTQFGRNTFVSLQIRNYRLYFTGQGVALSGTWMQTVAQGWLVLELTGSGTKLGLLVALQFLPMLLLGPWGGLVADRLDKRKILYVTQGAMGALALVLSILVFTHTITLFGLYAFGLALGFVRLFDNPARQTFVSELVPKEYVKNAVSLNATVNNLARAVGPSIAGVLIAGIGMAFCFLFTALAYVVSVVMLMQIDSNKLEPSVKSTKKKGELREGFRYVMASPLIRNTLIVMACVGTFVYEFQVSLPIIAHEVFKGDAKSYALLLAALGIGSVIGGLFAAGRHKVSPRHLMVFLFFLSISMVVTACMPTLFLATLGMLVVGFFSINVTSLGNTMIQLESASHMRGRVMALWGMAMMGSTPVGGPIVGFVGEYFGGRWGLALGGIAALVACMYGALTLLRIGNLPPVTEEVEEGTEEALAESEKLA